LKENNEERRILAPVDFFKNNFNSTKMFQERKDLLTGIHSRFLSQGS